MTQKRNKMLNTVGSWLIALSMLSTNFIFNIQAGEVDGRTQDSAELNGGRNDEANLDNEGSLKNTERLESRMRSVKGKCTSTLPPIISFPSAQTLIVEQWQTPNYQEGVKAYDRNGNAVPFTVDDRGLRTVYPGEHYVFYKATDCGGTTEKVRKVKVVPTTFGHPKFQFSGSLVVGLGDSPDYRAGVVIISTSNLKSRYTIDSSKVNLSREGIYKVYYHAENATGKTVAERPVRVVYRGLSKPKFVLPNPSYITTYLGKTPDYTKGVKAYDEMEPSKKFEIDDSEVNIDKLGTYKVKFTAKNKVGSTYAYREVRVVEEPLSKPRFSFPSKDIEVEVGKTPNYRDGVKAFDNKNDSIDYVVDARKVSTNTVGEYPVYYTAVNQAGVTTEERKVIIKKASSIKAVIVVSPKTVRVPFGAKISNYLSGVVGYGTDENDELYPLNVTVKIGAPVDTKISGEHIVIYQSTDKYGNIVDAKRTYIVEDKKMPTIQVTPKRVDVAYGSNLTNEDYIKGVRAVDALGNKIFLRVSGTVDTRRSGEQKIEYTAVDEDGYSVSDTRIYNVLPAVQPDLQISQSVLPLNTGTTMPDLLDGVSAVDVNGTDITSRITVVDDGGLTTLKNGQYIVKYEVKDSLGVGALGQRIYTVGGSISNGYVMFTNDTEITNSEVDEANAKMQIEKITGVRVEEIGMPGIPAHGTIKMINDGNFAKDSSGRLSSVSFKFEGANGSVDGNANIAIGYGNGIVTNGNESIVANNFATNNFLSNMIYKDLVTVMKEGDVTKSVAYRLLTVRAGKGPRIVSWKLPSRDETPIDQQDIIDTIYAFKSEYEAQNKNAFRVNAKVANNTGSLEAKYGWHVNQVKTTRTRSGFAPDTEEITNENILKGIRELVAEGLLTEEGAIKLADAYGLEYDVANTFDNNSQFIADTKELSIDELEDAGSNDDWLIELGLL